MKLPTELLDPPAEYSVMPFWFWNDTLEEAEIVRQIEDFENHGVFGFIIHPRIGLPQDVEWMSAPLLDLYAVAIAEAARRGMKVLLYDEGMYPSGSAAGQVVAADPAFACRCLARIELPTGREPELKAGENLVGIQTCRNGTRIAVVDRRADSYIRGLHYRGEGPEEETYAAGDILNPAAVAMFLRLVYDRFAARFAEHFGKTVFAIFTDEPGLLGKCREPDVRPGTTGILEHVNRILGYDFTPHLPALWYDDEPEAEFHREAYHRAVRLRLEETYYAQLSAWCELHGLPLTGHPDKGDDIGVLRHFHIPGQDLVWRWVLPDNPSALEGAESTQGKCASSAAQHAGRRRNSNECCGAYGHELTWDEMQWLARWCFVRGTNLLYPHAFYYSVRGPRWDERPPDVGPNSPWWERYREYADACRRLSWLNTDCEHVCAIAILGRADALPWYSAKICFRHQRDFNYVEERELLEAATLSEAGIALAGMMYRVLLVEYPLEASLQRALKPLQESGRVIHVPAGFHEGDLIQKLDAQVPADVTTSVAAPDLRVRHIRKNGLHWYMLFNEGRTPLPVKLSLSVKGESLLFNAATGQGRAYSLEEPVRLEGYELKVLAVAPDSE